MLKSLVPLVLAFFLMSAGVQSSNFMVELRKRFQEIKSEEDIERLLNLDAQKGTIEHQTLKAYQAAATCMQAEYAFSPVKKLRYFNRGKEALEENILAQKTVENVYLRLLIQLNVPRILNYNKSIETDLKYLDQSLAGAEIPVDYKYTMIKNLVEVADQEEVKKRLLAIPVTGLKSKNL